MMTGTVVQVPKTVIDLREEEYEVPDEIIEEHQETYEVPRTVSFCSTVYSNSKIF